MGGSSQAEVNVPARQLAADYRSSAKAALERVSGVYPAVRSGDLEAWSRDAGAYFTEEFQEYVSAGGDPEAPLGVAWQRVISATRELETATQDEALMLSAVLGQRVHELVSVAHGLSSGSSWSNPQPSASPASSEAESFGAIDIQVKPAVERERETK